MKKDYEKPQFYVESFVLSEHIADNCGTDPGVSTHGNGSQSGCYYTVYMEDEEEGMIPLNLFTSTSYCSPDAIGLIGEDGTVYIDVYDYNGTQITSFFSS